MSVTGIRLLHAIRLRQSTVRTKTWEETILQVDHRLSDFLISSQQVVIIDRNLQVFVLWEETWELKHPAMDRKEAEREKRALDLLWRKLMLCHNTNKQNFQILTLPSKYWVCGVWYIVVTVVNSLPSQRYLYIWITLKMAGKKPSDAGYYQVTKRCFYWMENQTTQKKKKNPPWSQKIHMPQCMGFPNIPEHSTYRTLYTPTYSGVIEARVCLRP